MRKPIALLIAAFTLIAVAVPSYASGFATFWAVVSANGTTLRSSGVSASSRVGLGSYKITFGRDISGCTSVDSVHRASAGLMATRNTANDGSTIVVFTRSPNGTKANLAFDLLVSCAP